MRTQEAKKIRVEDLLATLGHLPAKSAKGGSQLWYRSPLRADKEPSFKVNTKLNTWYDFGKGKGGNVIDFVMEHENTNLSGALAFLGTQNITHYINTKVAQYFGSEVKIKKVQEIENPALLDYLKDRKIDIETAKKYLKEVYYIANKKHYFALAMENDKQGFEIRNKYFKGGLRSKEITTLNHSAGGNGQISVFEGFMDFLSVLTEQKIKELKTDVIILNSTSQIDSAIQTIEERKYSKVFAFLDNDDAGREALEKLQSTHDDVKDLSHLYRGYNDPNQKLTSRLK